MFKKRKIKEQVEKSNEVEQTNEEIFTEQGDCCFSYQLSIKIENEKLYSFVFYGDKEIQREELLNRFFYVNDREILLRIDGNDRYLNRHKVEEMSFSCRKIIEEPKPLEKVQEVEKELQPEKKEKETEIEEKGIKEEEWTEETEPLNVSKPKKQEKKYTWKGKKSKRYTTKRYQVKKFRGLFLGIILTLTFSGMYATVRTFVVNNKVNEMKKTIYSLEKDETKQKETRVGETPYKIERYLNPFVESYMNKREDIEASKKREEFLGTFYANGVSESKNEGYFTRTLENHELIDIQEHEHYLTVSYQVVYRVDDKQVKRVLNVDVEEKENKFAVVSLPYFVELKSVKMKSPGLVRKEEGVLLSSAEDQDLQKFIESYLKKYAEGTREDLSYISNDTENLNEKYTLNSVISSEIYAQENDRFTAYVQASFKEKETEAVHTEYFSLEIIKENDKNKVKQLRHNLGGF